MDVEPACVNPPMHQPRNQPQAVNGLRFHIPGRACLLVKACQCFNVYNVGIFVYHGKAREESLDFRIFQELPNHSTK